MDDPLHRREATGLPGRRFSITVRTPTRRRDPFRGPVIRVAPRSSGRSRRFSTSDQSNGASAPAADARVRIVDLRFLGAKTLPRNGVVRFENAGWAPHFAVAAPLRRNAKQRAVARALRRNASGRSGAF